MNKVCECVGACDPVYCVFSVQNNFHFDYVRKRIDEAVKSERDRCWAILVDLYEHVFRGPRGDITAPFSHAMERIRTGEPRLVNPEPEGG